jgi:2-oxoglutarate ferredoxin oxidoreductase subunit delta
MVSRRKVDKIEINLTWCKRCGICAAFCPKGVYEKSPSGEPQVIRIEDCTECRLCELYCPEYAVTVMEGR